jgi:hypothetical protein
MQEAIVRQAIGLLETANGPRTTAKAPFGWKESDPDWRARYGRVDPARHAKLLALGEERRRQRAARAAAKAEKET